MKLTVENTQIELDQVTILVAYIQSAFVDSFGIDADINEWDSSRIQAELAEIFSPGEFQRLFMSDFGRGVIVGAWMHAYILGSEEEDEIYV